MKHLLILVTFIFPALGEAASYSGRRVAELKEGSTLLIQLNDPVLLGQRKHEWIKGNEKNGFRCSLKTGSHFDRDQAEKSGPTIYTVTQNNPNDSVSVYGQARDQFTIWLTTENKELPLLSLDCFRVYLRELVTSSPITFANVQDLLKQPELFQRPILGENSSQMASDLVPKFNELSRIKLLAPLKFSAVKNENGSVSISEPTIVNGKLNYDGSATGRSDCRISFRRMDLDGKPYDVSLPAGLEFQFTFVTGLAKSTATRDMQYVGIAMKEFKGMNELSISCMDDDHFYKSYSDFEQHFRSIFEITF